MVRVGVVGASGYTGVELLRLIAAHPDCELVAATADTSAGALAPAVAQSLTGAYAELELTALDVPALLAARLDVAFLAIPHEAALRLAPLLLDEVECVVDLSAAF